MCIFIFVCTSTLVLKSRLMWMNIRINDDDDDDDGTVPLRCPWKRGDSVEGGLSPPPSDLPNYWTDFQNSNVIR